jgi:glucose 1-dehydrogenase
MNPGLMLKNQIAIVTGASSGIGRAVAIELAKQGASVCVNYNNNQESANEVVEFIKEKGGEAIAVKASVSDEAQVQYMFNVVLEKYGTLDILVNNAGIQKDAAFENMTLDQWNEVIATNLTGQFLCTREAIKEYIRRGLRNEVSRSLGKIICISSVHDVIPWAGHVNYASSKGGIQMFMKSVAQEFASRKIRVNSISPGAIKTPINRPAWETPEALDQLMKLIPSKRIGLPEDVAKAAAWLASDESDYVNGVTLYVDGGMTLYPGFELGG